MGILAEGQIDTWAYGRIILAFGHMATWACGLMSMWAHGHMAMRLLLYRGGLMENSAYGHVHTSIQVYEY